MERYHTRHPDKAIADAAELRSIVRDQRIMTLAMSAEGVPYLVTVNHVLDAEQECLYFHCGLEGRKLDCIRANPRVYGQILEDRGYMPGQCDHAFRTVQFEGTAELVEDPAEKLRALTLLVERQEPDPNPVKKRLLHEDRLRQVGVVRVRVSSWSGKKNG